MSNSPVGAAPKGDKGDTGDQGVQGDQGIQGNTGLSATADAGVTATLSPGSPATVTNVGTLSAAEFDFGIPEGEPGTPGLNGGSLPSASVQSVSFTAVAETLYPCNTTAGPITLTFPASPSADDLVGFYDYANTFSLNTLTLNGNGENIISLAETMAVDVTGATCTFRYVDSTVGWRLDAAVTGGVAGQPA